MACLYYFDGRGRGEIVRMTLAAAGVPFTEELVTERNTFLEWIKDDKLLFEQLPMLETDGKQIVQTNAIVRYLGRKYGLFGQNLDEEVLIDQYYEGGRDFLAPTLPLCFVPEKDVLDTHVQKALSKYLPIFNKIAEVNGTGFLVGKSLTIADISLLEVLLVLVEYLGIEILKNYPAMAKFYDVVTSCDNMAAYLKGPQRKRKNDEHYVRNVKVVLAWD